MAFIDKIKSQAKGLRKKIIFPEGEDERILKAVKVAMNRKMIQPVLVGNPDKIRSKAKLLNVSLKNVEIINPIKDANFKKYVKVYSRKSKIPEKTAEFIVQKPLFFSALELANRDVDGMVAGAVSTSGEVIAVCREVIGLQKNISVPSSYFIMEISGYKGGEKGALMYADASVNPNPSPAELADIAVTSGITARTLFKWKPRVAILSFSTKGSAEHPDVCKVIAATRIAQKKAKGIMIDGELQADAALVESVAKKKIQGNVGKVAGKANVLIFPDLDAGNIAYKLTQRLAKAAAYGPILQGFARPVSDLSRGATVEDIVGVISIVTLLAARWPQ